VRRGRKKGRREEGKKGRREEKEGGAGKGRFFFPPFAFVGGAI